MRRFRFSLQKLLDLKGYREREWEIKLGEITGHMQDIRNQIETCGRERRSGFDLRGAAGGDLAALVAAENYVRRMEGERRRLEGELERLAEERAEIQRGYLEAQKERKAFEKLKERQELSFYREQKAAEFAMQDDLNGSAAARKIEESGGRVP